MDKMKKNSKGNNEMEKILIHTPYIQMQQLLKWIGVAENGSMAKEFCREGLVRVNGHAEIAPGKKIYPGDILEIEGIPYEIEAEANENDA